MPIEPTSLVDDNIKELFYGFTKTSIRTIKSAIAWKDKMYHAKGTKCYFNRDFDY